MLGTPSAGWADVSVSGNSIGSASYIEDVPNSVLDAFIAYFSGDRKGKRTGFNLEFDSEGFDFAIVEFAGNLYVISDDIEDTDSPDLTPRITEIKSSLPPVFQIAALAKEAIDDIRKDIDEWQYWNIDTDDTKAAMKYRSEYLEKCDILENLIKQYVPHETCISNENTCENTCFTGNGTGDKCPAS